LEGEGIAYGNNFTLEVVDKTIPLSKVKTVKTDASDDDSELVRLPPPANLNFARGLKAWWNDNPTHDTEDNYNHET